MLDGAPNHRCGSLLAVPSNISLLFLPPYAPELNPQENIWDEIREKIFKNYAGSNPWTPSTPNSNRQSSTSKAIQ